MSRERKEFAGHDDVQRAKELAQIGWLGLDVGLHLVFDPTDPRLKEVEDALNRGAEWHEVWGIMHKEDDSSKKGLRAVTQQQANAAEFDTTVQLELMERAFQNTSNKA